MTFGYPNVALSKKRSFALPGMTCGYRKVILSEAKDLLLHNKTMTNARWADHSSTSVTDFTM